MHMLFMSSSNKPKIDWSFMGNHLPSTLFFSRDSSGQRINAEGRMQNCTDGEPRFDYDRVTLEPRGLLLEGQSTNNILQSSSIHPDVVSPWGDDGVAVYETEVLAPDGSADAVRMTGGSADVVVRQDIWTGAIGEKTISVWLRSPVQMIVKIQCRDASSWSNGNAEMVEVTTKWQRFSVTGVTTTNGARFGLGGGNSITDGSVLEMWGAQVEAGGIATSYIPTTTSVVTRAADILKDENLAYYRQEVGTLLIDFVPFTHTSNFPESFSLTGGGDKLFSYFNIGTNQTSIKHEGYFDAGSSGYALNLGERVRIALRYEAGNYKLYANGAALAGSANAYISNSIDALRFLNSYMFGHLRSFKYWNHALSNVELERITL